MNLNCSSLVNNIFLLLIKDGLFLLLPTNTLFIACIWKRRRVIMKDILVKVANKENLTYEETYQAINTIMSGKSNDAEIASLLTGLSMKGETNEEITASAAAMRDKAIPVETQIDTLDIVGTGGDRSYSFNISSTAAMTIAAAGVPVSKHGNRSASSKSGAADCIEALGISLDQTPELAQELINDVGICFLFAQNYHQSMKYVASVRKTIGIRTVFNLLGPITNPAKPKYQVLGVYSEELIEPMAQVIKSLGVERGVVVYGQDVMDELSISAPSSVLFFDGDHEERFEIHPQDYGLGLYNKADIVGGDPLVNAEITRNVLSGKEEGAKLDIVLLNAGMGLFVARKAASIQAGIDLAREAIYSGKAEELLNNYILRSQRKVLV